MGMTREVDGPCHRDRLNVEKLRSAFPTLEHVPLWDELILNGDSTFNGALSLSLLQAVRTTQG